MSISGHANEQDIPRVNSRPSVKQLKNCSIILSNALVSKEASSAVDASFESASNSCPFVLPNGLFHGCIIANANVYVLPQSHNDSARKFCSNWTIQVVFPRINVRLYGRFARFRILVVVFGRRNSQSETLIFWKKPIRLRESCRQRWLFLCVTILVTLWKQRLLWRSFGVDIVVKNKSNVV